MSATEHRSGCVLLHPAARIGRALGVTTRTVHRRLARLRDRFGVATTAELLHRLGRHHM